MVAFVGRVWATTLAVALAGCAATSPSPFVTAPPTSPEGIDLASFGWWVADLRIGDAGHIDGYGFQVGLLDDTKARGGEMVELAHWPVELAGVRGPLIVGPARGRVVYLSDDGVASELRMAEVTGEVGRAVATFPEVVWTMAIDPTGQAVYVVLLGREAGDDRGVWRVPLDRDAAPARILPPSQRGLAATGEGGIRLVAVIRFVRELQVSADGTILVRRACGEPFGSCDLDVISLTDGAVKRFAETDVTELLGVVDDLVVGGLAGECLPPGACRRTALNLRTGLMVPIAPTDGRDRIAVGDGGQGLHVLMEDVAGLPTRYLLRVTDLGTGVRWAATEPLADLWYQLPFPGELGVEVPRGWILVSAAVPTAIHLQSGAILPLELPKPEPGGIPQGLLPRDYNRPQPGAAGAHRS